MVEINTALINIHTWSIYFIKKDFIFPLSDIIHDFDSCSIIDIYEMVLISNMCCWISYLCGYHICAAGVFCQGRRFHLYIVNCMMNRECYIYLSNWGFGYAISKVWISCAIGALNDSSSWWQ